MTTRPEFRIGRTLVPGLLAAGLFAVMVPIVLGTNFQDEMAGFGGVESITAELGYAMFGFYELQTVAGTEPFLISVLLIAIVLDAALDASLVLAKREEGGEPVTALSSAPDDAPEPVTADGGESQTGDAQ